MTNFQAVCLALFLVAFTAIMAFSPTSEDQLITRCGVACHTTNRPMLSYSKKDGCVCGVPQGPL